MSRLNDIIALAITPEGACGLAGRLARDGVLSLARRESHAWQSGDGGLRADELAGVLAELRAGAAAGAQGYVAMHPSWIYCEQIAVPPASRSETHAYLSMLVSRRWPDRNGSTVRWSWLPIQSSGREERRALLALVRIDVLAPVEEAFAREKIPLKRIVPLPVALAHMITDRDDYILSSEEKQGVGLCEFRGGSLVSSSWIPSQGDDPEETYRLMNYLLPEDVQKLYVARDADAPVHFNGARATLTFDAERRLKELIPAGDWKSASIAEKAAGGLIAIAAAKSGDAIDFAPHTGSMFPGINAFSSRVPLRKAAKWAAILAILFFASMGARMSLERVWQRGSEKAAAAVSIDEDAVLTNIAVLQKVDRDRKPVLDYLLELKRSKPDGVTLESFEFDAKGNVSIAGQAGSLSIVQQFTANLGKSKRFTQASTQSTKMDQNQVKFTIRCKLKGR